jgi:hypothetical protein
MPMLRQELETIPAPGRRVGVLQAAGISPATYYRHLQLQFDRWGTGLPVRPTSASDTGVGAAVSSTDLRRRTSGAAHR